MEQNSKKILKRPRPEAHGRSKFTVDQAKYIAEKLRDAFLKTKVGNFREIKKLMLEFSREYLAKGNKGREVSNIGATTIYTFLEKHNIPAPTKIQRGQTEESSNSIDIKVETNEETKSLLTARTEIYPIPIEMIEEETLLKRELERRKNEIILIESKLEKFRNKNKPEGSDQSPSDAAIPKTTQNNKPHSIIIPTLVSSESKGDQQAGFTLSNPPSNASTASTGSSGSNPSMGGGFPGMNAMNPMMGFPPMMNPSMMTNPNAQLMMIWGLINQFMHCMMQANRTNTNSTVGQGAN